MKHRKNLAVFLCLTLLSVALLVPAGARADFGIKSFSVLATEKDGTPVFQAGSHPYEYTVSFEMNQDSEGMPEGKLIETFVELPRGLVGNPLALPRCGRAAFDMNLIPACRGDAQVGVIDIELEQGAIHAQAPLYNLTPSPGSPATIGTSIDNNNSFLEPSLRSESDYGVTVADITIPTKVDIQAVSVHIWGTPMAPAHDPQRTCVNPVDPEFEALIGCSSDAPSAPFLTLPTSCEGPLKTTLLVASLQEPDVLIEESVLSTDESGTPFGMDGCNALEFEPTISAQPTTNLADAPSGLDFNLHQPQPPAVQSEVGQTEVCGVGAWKENPSEYAYQWLRNGAPIPSAEASEYVTEEADADTALQCEVIATNPGGEGHAASPVALVLPPPATAPPTPAKPTVHIEAGGEQTATCDPGAWGGEPSFSYRWFRNGALAPGESEASYAIPGKESLALQCEVLGTNTGGTVVSFSANAIKKGEEGAPGAPSVVPPDSIQAPQIHVSESALPLATAAVKDTKVTLPEGMTLNPAAGGGREACASEQIGHLPQAPGVHFSAVPQTCPNASKLGTIEVSSPLVDHKIEGAVYLAEPYRNPFGSLLAIYLAVEDPQAGIVAKLAGRVEPDPRTGQLTTTVTENPQLPLEDVAVHFFGGPRGP